MLSKATLKAATELTARGRIHTTITVCCTRSSSSVLNILQVSFWSVYIKTWMRATIKHISTESRGRKVTPYRRYIPFTCRACRLTRHSDRLFTEMTCTFVPPALPISPGTSSAEKDFLSSEVLIESIASTTGSAQLVCKAYSLRAGSNDLSCNAT
jgi:hypothetical protein